MQISKLSSAAALGVTLTVLLETATRADSIYVGAPAVIEQQVMVPSTTVVEKRSVLVPQPSTTVVEKRTTSCHTHNSCVCRKAGGHSFMTVGTRKAPVSSTSMDMSLQSGPYHTFSKRIDNMREQVDLGVSKGLMSLSTADSFRTRLNGLASEATSVAAAGTPKSMSD